MDISDEDIIAQFAALSSTGDEDVEEIEIPHTAVKTWKWEMCMVMKHMGSRMVHEDAFSSAIRRAWPLHPSTEVQGLGSNCFLVEFKEQEELLRIMARGAWLCQKDMVITRLAVGPTDLTHPIFTEFDCWVEVHGVPPESIDDAGLKVVLRNIGKPLTEAKSFFFGGQKVYKQKMSINLKEPLKPKLSLRHPTLGRQWVYVVYDNIANVCQFCARVGHSHQMCPAKLKLKLMKQDDKHNDQLQNKEIPDIVVGKWLTNRAYVPRKKVQEAQNLGDSSNTQANSPESNPVELRNGARTSQERRLKRPIDLNNDGQAIIMLGQDGADVQEDQTSGMHLNSKRAKEANPNSPSRFQS